MSANVADAPGDTATSVPPQDANDSNVQEMMVEETSMNVSTSSTGESSGSSDTGLGASGGNVSTSSGGSDVDRLYETVSDISKRQRGQFPGMVPHSCVIDPHMVSFQFSVTNFW